MQTALLVAGAGAAGVLARYGLASAWTSLWAIVAINVAGSFALGWLAASSWPSPDARAALGTGFLGGFTTFSTFSVQVVEDLEAGRTGRAALYVAMSVGLGIAAAFAGYRLASSSS